MIIENTILALYVLLQGSSCTTLHSTTAGCMTKMLMNVLEENVFVFMMFMWSMAEVR
jgi:hypothetical protein